VTVVPFDYDLAANPQQIEYEGIFISNGPGDPQDCVQTIASIRWAMSAIQPPKPIFGICLGNQILGLACGATTYEMKYGNRGMNQPFPASTCAPPSASSPARTTATRWTRPRCRPATGRRSF